MEFGTIKSRRSVDSPISASAKKRTSSTPPTVESLSSSNICDEQQEMSLYCGAVFATVSQPLRACSSPSYGATQVRIAAPGTCDPDTNPSRISPRNLSDVALGSDRLWKKDTYSLGRKLTVVNLTNKAVLYNLLSSFSGAHFVSPRTVQAEMTFHFYLAGGGPGGGGDTNFASSTGTFCFNSSTCTVNRFPGRATVHRCGTFTPSAVR
jgi:hypothetical protein